ncbi:MAG TPA: aminotransferase class V-fold PLP-dependent enzyme [Candidatus Paceibacterota bacterium]|nr:aminotransferase class V-fold PLP-dependent enzyme [Candidatus Paceibacterota bacterium]
MRFFRRTPARTYLDYAGAMPVSDGAREAFLAALEQYGNPGAIHTEGRDASGLLETARRAIAAELAVKAAELTFVSGGTEGNDLAILGAYRAARAAGRRPETLHAIASAIEHPSVLECFARIAQEGVSVTYVSPDARGLIRPEAVAAALTQDTFLVSVGWANGEIGTIQPLSAIAARIRAHEKERRTRVLLHADAGQAPLYAHPHAHTLGVDLLTLDGGKLGSPRGIGALYAGHGAAIAPILAGGGQEDGMRPGTPAVALAAGLAAALREVSRTRAAESARLAGLREQLIARIAAEPSLAGTIVNGTAKEQLPHLLSISVPGIDNEYAALSLDQAGFAIATKSACREGERESHVVAALCGAEDAWRARSALRISLGEASDAPVIDAFAAALAHAAALSRRGPAA